MKDCLVSFSSGDYYNNKLLSLLDSAKKHWRGDYLIYSLDHKMDNFNGIKIHKGLPKGCPSHQEIPYFFKFAIIEEAQSLGYERIVWLDTSMQLAKDITPLFGNKGIGVFHNLGHELFKYISDDAMCILNISDVSDIPQIWGGALFFDFTNKNTIILFNKIRDYAKMGAFNNGGSVRKGFVAHRHDQAIMSVILHNKCNLYPYGMIASKEHFRTKEYGDNVYIIYG